MVLTRSQSENMSKEKLIYKSCFVDLCDVP